MRSLRPLWLVHPWTKAGPLPLVPRRSPGPLPPRPLPWLLWRSWSVWLCAIGVCVALLLSPSARAQSAGNPLDRLPETLTPKPPPPKVSIAPAAPVSPILSQRLTPTRINVQGVKAVPFDQVVALTRDLVGHEVSVGDLVARADKITRLYHDRGFPLSLAFVPPQAFEGGVVRIVVVEGHITKVVLDGDPGPLRARVMGVLDPLLHEQPLRQASFERAMRLLGQLPGLTSSANVPVPTTTDGSTTLTLKVSHKRGSVSAGLATNQPGAQALVTVSETGNTPLGEQLSVSTLVPPGRDQQHYWAFSYAMPLGDRGWSVKVDGTHYRAEPDSTLGLPDYVQRITSQDKVSAMVNYPFILSNTQTLTGSFGGYAVSNEDRYDNQINGASLGLRSQIRALQAQIDGANASATSQRTYNLTFTKGLNVLGAGAHGVTNIPGASVENPVDTSFWRIGASVSQANQWPWWGLGTVVAATAQYSPQRLASSEQITFGGQRFALGYQPGETAGDYGYAASFELNRPFKLPWGRLKSVTPYASYALAEVFLNSGTPVPHHLESVAIGARVSDSKHYNVDLNLAKPVGDRPTENTARSLRVNLAFSYQFP